MWLTWWAYWWIAARFAAQTRRRESLPGVLQHAIPLLIGFYLMFHDRDNPIIHGRLFANNGVRYIGNLLTLEGLVHRLGSRSTGRYWSGNIVLKEGHRLIRTGPYAIVRHPIYTGMIIAAIGSALVATSGDAFIGFIVIAGSVLVKSLREEAY